jgi:sulfite exporter TauE/SafE
VIEVILVFWTGIFLGILHTIMPCEDKAIFCFYAFGVSRDWKQAFRILNLYGLGLFLMNFIIGVIISYFAAAVGTFFRTIINPYIFNMVGAASLIISGIVMIAQLHKNRYYPHIDQLQELGENLPNLRSRKRTAFLLGLLAGIPPCIFEIAIYLQAINISVIYGWGNGALVLFFFGIGTWLGLIPLAVLGSASGRLSKFIQQNILQRQNRTRILGKEENQDKDPKGTEDSKETKEKSKSLASYKIEIVSAIALIVLGVIFLILASLGISIFPLNQPINAPPPFNFFIGK